MQDNRSAEENVIGTHLVYIAADGFAWSPEGARLAVIMLATGSDMGAKVWRPPASMFMTGRKGSFQRIVRQNVGNVSWSPDGKGVGNVSWSPDGKRIAYITNDGMYTVAASGGSPTRITNDEAAVVEPFSGASALTKPLTASRGRRMGRDSRSVCRRHLRREH